MESEEIKTVYPLYIPKNLEEGFDHLSKRHEDELIRQVFRGESELSIQDYLELRSGSAYSWYLWDNARLAQYFNKLGITDPDHMLMIIFTSYARHLDGKPIKLKEQVKAFQKSEKDRGP